MTFTTRILEARSAGTTDGQYEVLDATRRWLSERGYSPTVRELADGLGVTPTDVYQKLVRLRRDGLVEWEDGKSRTLRVVEVAK